MKRAVKKLGKIFAIILIIIAMLGLLEVLVRGYLRINPYSGAEIKKEELFIPLHPYFGHHDESPRMLDRVEKKDESEYVVLLIGGSTALTLPWVMQKYLNQKNPFPEISRFRVILAAHHGYHTTQDKNVLVDYLSNGSEIDMVVCVEGFNNLVRPLENYAYNLPLNYPGWYWVAGNLMEYGSPEAYYLAIFLDGLKTKQPVRSLKSLQLGLNGLVQLLAKKFHHRGLEVIQEKITSLPSEEKMLVWENALDIYRRDILFMNTVARCRGIDIIFFLHAMLGYERKTVTAFETKFLEDSPMYDLHLVPYSIWTKGYDMLRESGEKLRESGVDYLDFSTVFKSVELNPFIDLVHMNKAGSDIFAEKLADEIILRIRESGTE